MQRYVAFVAGLPCGRESVGMDTLRNLFTRLGFLNVEPFLTNGNVIFETAPVGVIGPLEAQISRFLTKSLAGEEIHVFIRTPQELRRILSDVPFLPEDVQNADNHLFVVFLGDKPDERAKKQLRIRRTEIDELRLNGKEIYWLRRPSNEPVPPPLLSEILDAPATVRSFQTITRLVAKFTPHVATQSPPADISQSAQSRR